ncbi:putative reverse transcriptase domain-containing protein [Tanacetum coccineum]
MVKERRKRENNLRQRKWDDVIVIQDSDDEVDIFDNTNLQTTLLFVVDEEANEGPNATLHVNEIVDEEIVGAQNVNDDVPNERVKRTNISRVETLMPNYGMPCDLKPTRMCIELANKTTQFPKGIAENVMVKVDKFVFRVDFVILDMEEDHRIPIILGRPFVAIAHAKIDVFNKKISFKVGDEIITFDLEKSISFPPSNEDTCHASDIINLSVVNNIKEILPQDHDNSIEPILYQLPEMTLTSVTTCDQVMGIAVNGRPKES